MKTENELLIQGIELEIDKIKSKFKNFNMLSDRIDSNDFDFCIGFLKGKIEILEELEKLRDLKRSKNALYNIDTDINFSSDDIPF
jgi:hypothetical protein